MLLLSEAVLSSSFLFKLLSDSRYKINFAHIAEENPKLLHGKQHELLISGINRAFIIFPHTNYKKLSISEYLDLAKEHRIQIIRVFIPEGIPNKETGKVCSEYGGFEYDLGKYDTNVIRNLDILFKEANKRDIYIILVIFDAFKFTECLNLSVYSKLGGKPINFFDNGLMREYPKKRVAFLVERYKNEKSLLAWEPMNEIIHIDRNFFNKNRTVAIKIILNWFEDMARTIRKVDNNHLITQSVGGGVIIDELFKSPYLDIIQPHIWGERNDPEKVAILIEEHVEMLNKYTKPIIIGEFASYLNNPLRDQFIEKFLQISKKFNISALLWTNTPKPVYGGMDDNIFDIYKRVYSDRM